MTEADPFIGRKISNHMIFALLGRGGSGAVYLAHHTTLRRDVAIKLLSPASTTNPDYVDRFLREARAAASLNHPGLIAVHDAGVEDEAHYIIMEYVQGKDLGLILKEN